MSLSTSNSKAVYLRIVLAIGIGMGASLGLVRVITYANDATSDNFLGRVQTARANLPRITAENDDLVMFYGSSMVRAGFSPRQFDSQLKDRGISVKSFNFGFGGLNPYFQDFLARRIGDAFEADNRRLKLALIEFNPFQTTTTRWAGARAIEDSFITLLATDEELFQIALDDPTRGIRLFNIRYLRDSVSAEAITSFFGRSFQEPRPRSTLPVDEEIRKKRRELGEELDKRFRQDYPDYKGEAWSYSWQGGGTIPEERSAETLEIFNQFYATSLADYRMDADRLNRINRADIIDLHFEEKLVASFVRLVKEFQKFSDQVEVLLLPKNTDWIKNPPEALARQQAVVDRIRRETGVVVRDLQEMESVPPEMFSDTTHLNRYRGAVAFTQYLVDQYEDYLK